ncbi:glutamate--cysteine ligase [compost metagenome]
MLRSLREDNLSFFAFAQRQSERHAAWFRSRPLDAESQAAFTQSARDSLAAQTELEASQQGSFEEFVAHYMAAIEPSA